MTKYLPNILRSLLIALLLLTTHSVANARGGAMISGQMVLCTGHGPKTVFIDENGQPVKSSQLCPDCTIHLFAAPDAPALIQTQITLSAAPYIARYKYHAPLKQLHEFNPRAPPLLM